MRCFFFSLDQEQEVRAHLGEVLSEPTLSNAVVALDWACQAADAAALKSPGEWRRLRAQSHAHFRAVLKHATALRDSLRRERPLAGTYGLDWSGFDAGLERVIESARAHVEATKPTRRRGRVSDEGRDDLIAVAWSIYPEGSATKTANSHFEKTVEVVLQYLGRDVADVHGLICDALDRRPHPPFTLTTTQRLRAVK